MLEQLLVSVCHPWEIGKRTIGIRGLGWSWLTSWQIACIGHLYVRDLRRIVDEGDVR